MTSSNEHAVSVSGLSFAYGSHTTSPILHDISFSVPQGSITAIVGPSGAGKSTLLRLIAGQMQPAAGRVQLRNDSSTSVAALYHPQDAMLLPWLTIRDNAEIGLRLSRLPGTMATIEILRHLALADIERRHPAQLSGGQIERTALARTILTPAAAYLLDEPLAGTDYVHRIKIEDFLVDFIRERSSSALLVTHDLPQAVALGDRLLVLLPSGEKSNLVEIEIPASVRSLSPRERRGSTELGPVIDQVLQVIESGKC